MSSNGKIIIDIIKNIMTMTLDSESYEVGLGGDGSSHAEGDKFVMKSLIELLNHHQVQAYGMPSFDECIRSTHIGLLCEYAIDTGDVCHFNITQ